MEIRKSFTFEAAHRLPFVPPGHKCGRLHGHSFRVTISVAGPIVPGLGWVVDFADISAAMAPLLEQVDHSYLNEIAGLENPTSELIAKWFWDGLCEVLAGRLTVKVAETCRTACVYRGED